ncbi:MAG: hypothetical protein K6E47_13920 [Lachnospiraceae bacterium]|nr:hypothetical protein [Lachnospiraceae bacterium]
MRKRRNKWYYDTAAYHDVILSGTCMLARNFADYNFPAKLNAEDATKVVEELRGYTAELGSKMGGEYYSCRMEKLSNVDKDALIESHAITPSLKRKKDPSGLILSEDEGVSIMINDEDHVHIQAIKAGYNLREAYRQADIVDDFLDSKKPYCFSEKYGYLTSKLQDAGTGLHVSYMLSLPGITMGGKADALQDEISRFDVALKGIYGEGSKSAGFIFQLSNRKTLGMSENEIIENLEQVTAQIVDIERRLRKEVMKNIGTELKDRVYRSYGVLKYAKNLPQKDAMVLLAQLKLGSDCGIIDIKGGGSRLHRLMIEMQPGNLQTYYKKTMGSVQRDELRAKYLNEHLPELIEPEEDDTED